MPETSSGSSIEQQWKKIDYSANSIATLPTEIVQEILLRLPVKSLLKFRCVSKSWLSLISSPDFRKAHLEISTSDPNLAFHRIMLSMSCGVSNFNNCSVRSLFYEPMPDAFSITDDAFSITDDPLKDSARYVRLVDSCDGLICVSVDDQDLFLWNPSIRKSKKLPEFDPDVRHYVNIIFGFGFDETEKDYKVLAVFCVVDEDFDHNIVGGIYSLKTNSWRRINERNLIRNVGVPEDPVIFVQGKLHWPTPTAVMYKWNITSFDLSNEACGVVEQPNYGEGKFRSFLGTVGGCICVVCDFEKTRADVWVLKDYYIKESWIKVVSIPYVNVDPMDPRDYKPLCISPDGDVLLTFGGSFMVYNMKENFFRYPQIDDVNHFNTYVESLVSPHADADGE